jgi:hypothetical protein
MRLWFARTLFCLTLVLPLSARAQPADVTVFAAASVKNALDLITAEFQRQTGKRVALSYAASSTLARQIEQGALGRPLHDVEHNLISRIGRGASALSRSLWSVHPLVSRPARRSPRAGGDAMGGAPAQVPLRQASGPR